MNVARGRRLITLNLVFSPALIHKKRDKRIITRILGVRCSTDPERYLGLPNLVGRRKKVSFQNLKDRLQQRIDN